MLTPQAPDLLTPLLKWATAAKLALKNPVVADKDCQHGDAVRVSADELQRRSGQEQSSRCGTWITSPQRASRAPQPPRYTNATQDRIGSL